MLLKILVVESSCPTVPPVADKGKTAVLDGLPRRGQPLGLPLRKDKDRRFLKNLSTVEIRRVNCQFVRDDEIDFAFQEAVSENVAACGDDDDAGYLAVELTDKFNP